MRRSGNEGGRGRHRRVFDNDIASRAVGQVTEGLGDVGLADAAKDGDRLQHLRAVLPCEVRVISRTHPLSGRLVAVRSFKRLNGVLLLLVIELPYGSPGTIPAAARDVLGSAAAAGPAVVLDAAGWRRLRELVTMLAGRDGAGRRRRPQARRLAHVSWAVPAVTWTARSRSCSRPAWCGGVGGRRPQAG
jgi:hypothetical protein